MASIVAEVVTAGRDVVDPLNTAGSGWRIPHRYGQARDSKIDQPSIREPIQSRPELSDEIRVAESVFAVRTCDYRQPIAKFVEQRGPECTKCAGAYSDRGCSWHPVHESWHVLPSCRNVTSLQYHKTRQVAAGFRLPAAGAVDRQRLPRGARRFYHRQIAHAVRAVLGSGRLIAITGPIGVGKTVFLHRLQDEIASEKKVTVAESLSVDAARTTIPTLIAALF